MGRPARNGGGTRGHGYLPLAGQRFDWNCHTFSDRTLTAMVSPSIQGANSKKEVSKEKLQTMQVIKKCDSPKNRKIYKKSDIQPKELEKKKSPPKIQKQLVPPNDENVKGQVPIKSSVNIKQTKESTQPTQMAQVKSKFQQPNDFISCTSDHTNKSSAQQSHFSVQSKPKSTNSDNQLESSGTVANHPTTTDNLNYKRFGNNEEVVAKNEQPSAIVYRPNLLIYPFPCSYLIFIPSIPQPIYQTYNGNAYTQQLPNYIPLDKIKGHDLSPIQPPIVPNGKVNHSQPNQKPLKVIADTLDTQRNKEDSN